MKGDLGRSNTDGCGEYLDTEHCMTRSFIICTIHHNLRDDKVGHTCDRRDNHINVCYENLNEMSS